MVEKSITGIVTWLKNWFYDADQVDTFLNSKANKNLGTAGMNVVTDASGDISLEAKPTIPTVPSASTTTPSADTNSGSYGSGTTWARADHVHPKSSIYAEASHDHTVSNITDFPSTMTPSSHTHGQITNDGKITSTAVTVATDDNIVITDASDSSKVKRVANLLASHIKDSNANGYTNISSSLTSSSTQADINSAINTAIGTLSSIDVINVTSDKGTASASTMNKLYIEDNGSTVDVYYTERTGSSPNYTYSWTKLDTDILDDVTIPTDVSDLTDTNNTAFTPKSHTHGNILSNGTMSDDLDVAISSGDDSILFSDVSDSGEIKGSKTLPSSVIVDSNSYSALDVNANSTQTHINGKINGVLSYVGTHMGDKSDDIDWSYNSNGFVNGIKLHDKTSSGDDATGTITFHLKS